MSRSNSATKETDLRDRVLLGKRKSNPKILTDSSSGKSYALLHISIFPKQSLGYTGVVCQCPNQTRLLGRPIFATECPRKTQVKLKNLDRFQQWEVICIAPYLNISLTITWVYWCRLPMSQSNSATKETDLSDRVPLVKRK